MWLHQQRHLSHHHARWLNLLAEYQYRVVHIPGRTNSADFLTRQRFPDGQGPASRTGYDDPESALELYAALVQAPGPAAAFTHAGTGPDAPHFLHADFTSALRQALPSDPLLGPIAVTAQGRAPNAVRSYPEGAENVNLRKLKKTQISLFPGHQNEEKGY
jgi:hypothetical protein